MKVNLGFGGMCLFLPERDTAGNATKMHVVMPFGAGHETFLVYDRSALDSAQPPPSGEPAFNELSHWTLDLTHLGTTAALTLPPPGVADLEACPGFPSSRLSDFSPGWINARVTFSAGTASIPRCARGAHWRFGPGDPKPLAIRVVWTIDVPDGAVEVDVPDAGRVTLYPSPLNNELDLWVFHSPHLPRNLPPRTSLRIHPVGTHAAHFPFPRLLGCPTLAPPRFDRLMIGPNELGCFVLDSEPLIDDQFTRGLDVMCIAAKATLIP